MYVLICLSRNTSSETYIRTSLHAYIHTRVCMYVCMYSLLGVSVFGLHLRQELRSDKYFQAQGFG